MSLFGIWKKERKKERYAINALWWKQSLVCNCHLRRPWRHLELPPDTCYLYLFVFGPSDCVTPDHCVILRSAVSGRWAYLENGFYWQSWVRFRWWWLSMGALRKAGCLLPRTSDYAVPRTKNPYLGERWSWMGRDRTWRGRSDFSLQQAAVCLKEATMVCQQSFWMCPFRNHLLCLFLSVSHWKKVTASHATQTSASLCSAQLLRQAGTGTI